MFSRKRAEEAEPIVPEKTKAGLERPTGFTEPWVHTVNSHFGQLIRDGNRLGE